MKDIKVSVIIPVFNSSKSLENLINELSLAKCILLLHDTPRKSRKTNTNI